jgi:hypothetical protein
MKYCKENPKRTKITEIETKKIIQKKINETKGWFFEKINNIKKTLANLTNVRREKTQISKIRNKKGEITRNTTEIQGIIRYYFEKLYSNKFENLKKWTYF